MKKIFIFTCALMGIVLHLNTAQGLATITPGSNCWSIACTSTDYTIDTSCHTALCNTCKTSTTTSISGVQYTIQRTITSTCTNNVLKCACKEETTDFKCAKGWYGTATGPAAGCTKCPDNATCPGGNNSQYTCNSGYYKSNAVNEPCQKCPDGANCIAGIITCKAGYYKSGTASCTRCPTQAGVPGTSPLGASAVTSCYIPATTSFRASDTAGDFTYQFTSDCNYTSK